MHITHTITASALALSTITAVTLIAALHAPAAAAVVKWKAAVDGKWDAAANWAGNQLPGPNDDAANPFLITITHDAGNHTVKNLGLRGILVLSAGSLTVTEKVLFDGALFQLNGGTLAKATVADKASGGGSLRVGNAATSKLDGVTLMTTDVRHVSGGTVAVTGGLALGGAPSTFEFGGGSVLRFDGNQTLKAGRFELGTATVQLAPATTLRLVDNAFRLGDSAMPFTLGNASAVAAQPASLVFMGRNFFRRVNAASEVALVLNIAADRIANEGEIEFNNQNLTVAINAGQQFRNGAGAKYATTVSGLTLTADTFTNNGSHDDFGVSTYVAKNVFNNGSFTVRQQAQVQFAAVAGAPRANTSNKLLVEEGGQLGFMNGVRMVVGGTVQVDGKITIREAGVAAKGVQQAGTVSGKGTINGGWTAQQGFVKPGNSAGVLTIEGDYEQFAPAELSIELGGTTVGLYDRLALTGNAALGGTLAVDLIDGFVPAFNDAFDVLTAGAGLAGAFANALPALPGAPGLLQTPAGSFDVFYLGSTGAAGIVRLTHFQAGVVPEPAPWLMLAAGLLGLSRLTRSARA